MIPGASLSSLAVGDCTSIWGIGLQQEILRYSSEEQRWETIPGPIVEAEETTGEGAEGAERIRNPPFVVQQLAVGLEAVWLLTTTGAVFRRQGSSWTRMAGSLRFLAVGGFSHVWGVGAKTGSLAEWSGDCFEPLDEVADLVSCNSDGVLYALASMDGGRPQVSRRVTQRLSLVPVHEFQKLWDDHRPAAPSGPKSLGIFRPIPSAGHSILGDYAERTWLGIAQGTAVAVSELSDALPLMTVSSGCTPLLLPPVRFEPIWWTDAASSSRFGGLCFWRPVPPDGYASLGHVTTPSPDLPPPAHSIRCVNLALLCSGRVRYTVDDGWLWAASGVSLWAADSPNSLTIPPGTFLASASKPNSSEFFAFDTLDAQERMVPDV